MPICDGAGLGVSKAPAGPWEDSILTLGSGRLGPPAASRRQTYALSHKGMCAPLRGSAFGMLLDQLEGRSIAALLVPAPLFELPAGFGLNTLISRVIQRELISFSLFGARQPIVDTG